MITFYPRDIGMWRTYFRFDDATYPSKGFPNRDALIEFLKEHGVRTDDEKYPLEITDPEHHAVLGENICDVIQWTVIGWISEDEG